MEEESSFIKNQINEHNNIQKLKVEQEKINKKKLQDEIQMKNDFGIRKANKEVLKARGLYRKRKQYQGNAKVHNREKIYKKERLRKKLVKEYEGKPDVYGGETTGIRRDLVRSTQIKS